MLFIGVDLGTSAVKLLLMDENGKYVKSYPGNTRCISRIPDGPSRIRKTGSLRVWKESEN